MQRFGLLSLAFLLLFFIAGASPVCGQGDIRYEWNPPLHSGEMPLNAPLLPALNLMPALPLPEPLIPGTLLFNIEDFSAGYRILSATLDSRLYAYNISYQYGIYPVSPNGRYGIYTVPTGATDIISCGILDLVTDTTVDRFDTAGGCNNIGLQWSPDSTKILFLTRDEAGRSALGLRHDGQTTIFRPIPVAGVDIAGQPLIEEREYFTKGWLTNDIITFEIGINGNLSEQVFARLDTPDTAFPVNALHLEDTGKRLILSLPAQPVEVFNRGYRLTDLVTGSSFGLAPGGFIARLAVVSPDDSRVVYWAETEAALGTTHPLRLVIYVPDTDEQIVLLRFDGPVGYELATRPGELAWNPEGIYFYISQQPDAISPLQTGTYRIQPDGSNLEFVSSELLWDSLAP